MNSWHHQYINTVNRALKSNRRIALSQEYKRLLERLNKSDQPFGFSIRLVEKQGSSGSNFGNEYPQIKTSNKSENAVFLDWIWNFLKSNSSRHPSMYDVCNFLKVYIEQHVAKNLHTISWPHENNQPKPKPQPKSNTPPPPSAPPSSPASDSNEDEDGDIQEKLKSLSLELEDEEW